MQEASTESATEGEVAARPSLLDRAAVGLGTVLYLVFLAHAAFSALLAMLPDVALLTALHSKLGVFSLLAAVLWLMNGWWLARGHRLLLLTPALALLWLGPLAGVPLTLLFGPVDRPDDVAMLASAEIAIAIAVLIVVRRSHGGWVLPREVFTSFPRNVPRSLANLGLHLLLLALFLAMTLSLQFVRLAIGPAQGWITLGADGVHLHDVTYENDDGQRVRLMAMVHLGEWGGFESIFEGLGEPGWVVLDQGVRDTEGRLGLRTDGIRRHGTAGVADPRNVVPQPAIAQLQPVYRLPNEVAALATVTADRSWIVNADAEVSELPESVLAFVEERVVPVVGEATFWNGPLPMPEVSKNAGLVEALRAIRNRVLFDYLEEALRHSDRVAVPRDGLDVPDIAARLATMGFRPVGNSRRHRILSWSARLGVAVEGPVRQMTEWDPDEAEAFLREVFAARFSAARAGWRLIPATHESADAAVAWLGGLPTRYAEEQWPRSPVTGRPMTFVAEIARTEENARFMGRVARLRLFLDWDGYFGDDETDAYRLWIDVDGDPSRTPAEWSEEELAQLERDFGESDYGGVLRSERVPLRGVGDRFVSIPYVDTPNGIPREDLETWFRLNDEISGTVAAEHPEATEGYQASFVGGRPSWVQTPEVPVLPFFMQLYPDGELMWADGGHLYLFLDPDHPDRGAILLGQSS